MRKETMRRHLAAFVLPLAIAACTNSTGTQSGTAHLRVQLTDAPSVAFDSAVVYIGTVTLIPVEGSPIVITDEGGRFDLLQLQNGVTAELGDADIPAGDYSELRLVVDSAIVGLTPPDTFTDGTTYRSLKVPSGAESGIKVKLGSTVAETLVSYVTITPGETILVVDFDVSQNFKIQGNPTTPAGLRSVLFTPVLRAVVRNVAGSIAGTVTSSADGSPLPGLTVRATLQGTDPAVEVTAETAEDGTYLLSFLEPGTYDVHVDSFSATTQTVVVGEGQHVTGIDFSGTSTSTSSGTGS
jgi:hypothetical protein